MSFIMLEWIGLVISSLFVLMTSSLSHNSTFSIISQRLVPAIRKHILTTHGVTEIEGATLASGKRAELFDIASRVVQFTASVLSRFEPLVSIILELTALHPPEEHLLDVPEYEPPSPTESVSSDSSSEGVFVEEELKPARTRRNSFSFPSIERNTNTSPNDNAKRSGSGSCISMGCLFRPSPKLRCYNLSNVPSQPLRLKAKRQTSRDNLLTKLGKNHINRKLVAIKDLYPLLNLRQPPTPNDRQVRARRSDEDLSFLEDMHKVMRVLSMDYNRPSHSYDVSRIITIPSLADVLVSEEHLLKAGVTPFPICTPRSPDDFFSGYGFGTGFVPYFGSRWSHGSHWQATLDIVAQFETGPVRRNSRGLGLNGGFGNANSVVHPSLSKIERDARFRTLKDSWITWGLARRPDVTSSMRHELETLLDTPIVVPASPEGGPMVFELPVLTAVVKEGLRRRSAAVKLEKSADGYIQDVATATMLAAAGGQTRFPDPQTYDPARWLPLPMENSAKRRSMTMDIPWNQSERDTTLANMQIYAVAPPIVRRNLSDITSSTVDLIVITPKSKAFM